MTSRACTIDVTNDLDELARVQTAIQNFSRSNALDDQTQHTLLLVVEELFVNIVRHGYEQAAADTVTIGISVMDDGRLRLEIHDQSEPFDVSKPPPSPEEVSLEDMKVGGLGVFLVHQLARQISWERRDGINRTQVVLDGI